MWKPLSVIQPPSYDRFRCIGSDCEDTCCNGWGISIDRTTYDKYQQCRDPELGPALRKLITIDTKQSGENDYACIQLTETHCPFLAEGWCSVQQKLGESYLSDLCALYPRTMNRVGDGIERTLNVSCPEAARVVLLGTGKEEAAEVPEVTDFRMGNLYTLDTPNDLYEGRTYPHFSEIRDLTVLILTAPTYPLWKRLVVVSHLSDKLNEIATQGNDEHLTFLIQGYAHAVESRMFDDLLNNCRLQLERQLITVLELVICRITGEFVGGRFLDCYKDFMEGLQWTPEAVPRDVAQRYVDSYVNYYAPLMERHEGLMERYLANYIYRTLFPIGRIELNRMAGLHHMQNSISVQCMLMILHFAIIKTLLIGMAGFHKSDFGTDHVIKVIQSASKVFQHNLTYPLRALDVLTRNGMKNAASMAVLIQDPAEL